MADDTAAASFQRAPCSILLDRTAYIADRPNGTHTAAGFTHAGHAVEVSFQLADPPAPSHLCVFFPGGGEDTGGPVDPAVVCCEKDMAVVELRYPGRQYPHCDAREYYVYRADPNHPSLDSLPTMYTSYYVPNHYMPSFAPHELGLLPGGGGGYHIAALRVVPPLPSWSPEPVDHYPVYLYVLSSKTREWSITTVRSPWLRPPPGSYNHYADAKHRAPHETHKVIWLGGSTLGFVDFRRGILCYDVLNVSEDDQPPLHCIPFPPPVGSNWRVFLENRAASIRDVAFIDGVVRLVEVENLKRMVVLRAAARKCIPDVVHDSDFEKLSASSRAGDTMDRFSWANDGLRVVMWTRHLHNSDDHWKKSYDAISEDIAIGDGDPGHLGLLPPELMANNNGGSGSEATLTKDHEAGAPALSVHDGDVVVYLVCKRDQRTDETGWLLGINTRTERVQHVASVSTGKAAVPDSFFGPPIPSPYIPCSISTHMS